MVINEISTEELKSKLDSGDDFKLVMTFHDWAFKAKHIPGSINVNSPESATGLVSPSDEIVVYCVNPSCMASISAYQMMVENGFSNVRRYAGGLEAWEAAGLEFEGEDQERNIQPDNAFMK